MTKPKNKIIAPVKKTAKIKPVIKSKPVIKNLKNNRVAISEKLKSIRQATGNVEFEKGNAIEQKMIQEEIAPAQPEIKTTVEPEIEPEEKRGPGRPPGSKNKSTKRAQEEENPGERKIDQIMIYEEVALMGLCRRFGKDFKDIQLSPDEKDLLLSLQPDTSFLNRPSWPNYIVTNVSLILIKWMQAPTKKEETAPVETTEHEPVLSRQAMPENNIINTTPGDAIQPEIITEMRS